MGRFVSVELDPLLIIDSHLAWPTRATEVFCLLWFKEENRRTRFCAGAMLYSAWYDEELSCFKCDFSIAQFQYEAAVYAEENLIFIVMAVPFECAFAVCELEVLPVCFPDDSGVPSVFKGGKL